MERIALAVEQAPHAQDPDPGCQPGKDNRDSDLCAQWKAADAAAESAWWAFAGFWANIVVAIFSFAALVIAALAAWYARRVIDGSERPYLRVRITGYNFQQTEAPQGFLAVQYTVDNIGGTPATIDTFHESLRFETPDENPQSIEHMDSDLGGSNIYTLDKGDVLGPEIVNCSLPNIGLKAAVARGDRLILRINLSYFDLYQRRRNLFFKTYYAFGSPNPRFHTNHPPRIVEAPFNRAKQHQRGKVRRAWWRLKHRLGLRRQPSA